MQVVPSNLSAVAGVLAGIRSGAAARVAVLDNRDFRALLVGRVVSVVGDQLYAVAAMWLVFSLTGSTLFTGIAGFLTRAPSAFEFLVGPVVDRSKLDRVLRWSELVQIPLVLLVPLAAVFGHLNVWVVLAVMPLLGFADLFAGPAQNAAIPRIVDRERLVRANSLGAATKQSAIATARAVGGGLVAVLGAAAVYVVDALTFGIAAVAFARLSVPERTDQDGEVGGSDAGEGFDLAEYRADLRAGVGILTGSLLGWMLAAALLANFLMGVALAVLPAFAARIGGATTYGLLLAGMMAGRVVGSTTASVVDRLPLGRVTVVGFVASGLLWAGAVLVPGTVPASGPLGGIVSGTLVAVALFAASRIPAATYSISVLATMQTGVPDGMLGRVSSLVNSATAVVAPLGLLVGGALGESLGARAVMLAGAAGSIAVAVVWIVHPRLRTFGAPTAVAPGEFA